MHQKSHQFHTFSSALPLLIICILLLPSHCIKFTLEIPGLESHCLYEVMSQTQKYTIETLPKNQPKYQLQIFQSLQNQWISIYHKATQLGFQRMQIHKFAPESATYSFCIRNSQQAKLLIQFKFQTGVLLMQFELLPDKSDTENLDREITWLENQKSTLYEIIQKVDKQKIKNTNTSALLSTKMIIFAIIGLIAIVVVNFLFFKEMKNQLKRRKLI